MNQNHQKTPRGEQPMDPGAALCGLFFSALHSVTAILGTCDLDGWGEIIHKRGNVEERKNVQPL